VARKTTFFQWLARQTWFAAFGRRFVGMDRWLLRRTKSRWSAAGWYGLPFLLLTTTGRKSGEPRTQPLLYAPDGDAFIVIGSNWGQRHHPAWTGNLLAAPEATVTIEENQIPVRAELAEGAERDRLWHLATELWPAYTTYERRADGRELRVFRLARR
jgi:deazaflavin-dependent oxidoreductase (nitroreductase family)